MKRLTAAVLLIALMLMPLSAVANYLGGYGIYEFEYNLPRSGHVHPEEVPEPRSTGHGIGFGVMGMHEWPEYHVAVQYHLDTMANPFMAYQHKGHHVTESKKLSMSLWYSGGVSVFWMEPLRNGWDLYVGGGLSMLAEEYKFKEKPLPDRAKGELHQWRNTSFDVLFDIMGAYTMKPGKKLFIDFSLGCALSGRKGDWIETGKYTQWYDAYYNDPFMGKLILASLRVGCLMQYDGKAGWEEAKERLAIT